MDKGIIDPNDRPLTEAEQQDELDDLTYEQPVFPCPELDRALGNIEKEVDLLLAIYQLGE